MDISDAQLEELVRAAEEGNGLPIKETLDAIGALEERVRLLKEIDKRNAQHIMNDPSLPDLIVGIKIPKNSYYVSLSVGIDPPGWGTWNWQHLYDERYDPKANGRTSMAFDTRKK